MRCEPAFDCARARLALGDQLLEHRHDPLRIDARANGVRHRFLICLELILSGESSEYRASGDIDTGLRNLAVADVGENTGERHSDIRALCLFHLLYAVPANDVANLVAQDARKLVHLRGALDETAIDVDVTAGHGEGVHLA